MRIPRAIVFVYDDKTTVKGKIGAKRMHELAMSALGKAGIKMNENGHNIHDVHEAIYEAASTALREVIRNESRNENKRRKEMLNNG